MTNLRQPVYKTLLEIKEYYREYLRAAQQAHCPEVASVKGTVRNYISANYLKLQVGTATQQLNKSGKSSGFRLRHNKHKSQ
ncbi:hypothetical protein MHI27_14125 [Paenibacillus sp. FSL H8-0261]|uniref:hypothetical protein n=1 Tax=Paenibacillus sp. FSL H8-0261 TaxID=2921381 RepID=UPI00324DECE7